MGSSHVSQHHESWNKGKLVNSVVALEPPAARPHYAAAVAVRGRLLKRTLVRGDRPPAESSCESLVAAARDLAACACGAHEPRSLER
jgi:hypothetical protein